MKTNHQRNYKSTKDGNAVFNKYTVFAETNALPLSGKSVFAHVTCGDHTNGKRGIAKEVKGAKKFINSRTRFHENQALKNIVKNI